MSARTSFWIHDITARTSVFATSQCAFLGQWSLRTEHFRVHHPSTLNKHVVGMPSSTDDLSALLSHHPALGHSSFVAASWQDFRLFCLCCVWIIGCTPVSVPLASCTRVLNLCLLAALFISLWVPQGRLCHLSAFWQSQAVGNHWEGAAVCNLCLLRGLLQGTFHTTVPQQDAVQDAVWD